MKLLRSLKPDIVQTWLVHADFIGGLAAKLLGIKNIIWNIRYSNFQINKAKLSTILIIKILAKLSYIIPRCIIVVSKKAKKIYESSGYDKPKLKFIPNGYDLSILKADNFKRKNFQKVFQINKNVPLIGNVARFDPKKDHINLLKALSILKFKKIDFLCVFVGSNINKNNLKLISEIKNLKLSSYVKLLGQKKDITSVMNGIDIYVQSSRYGEGFPNVVAEAMACETPCIVTDVGDSAFIVGKTGWVVESNNHIKLANTIEKAIKETKTKNWTQRCKKSRTRIIENFEISKMINSYSKIWTKVINHY